MIILVLLSLACAIGAMVWAVVNAEAIGRNSQEIKALRGAVEIYGRSRPLTGDQGMRGEPGETGAQGLRGYKGDTGEQGPPGVQSRPEWRSTYHDNVAMDQRLESLAALTDINGGKKH